MGGWNDDDFEAFFFFVNAGIVKVVEEAQARIEMHGAVELGGPDAVALKVLTGSFVPHDKTHSGNRTMGQRGVYGDWAMG
jgi:hypothetical protein